MQSFFQISLRSGFYLFLFCLTFISGTNEVTAASHESNLQEQIRELKLGFGPYTIGSILNKEQIDKSQANRMADSSYKGTYKFQDQDVFVVADEKNNTILAIYQRQEDVDNKGIKNTITNLLDRFGEPTATAHDKLIYWAYGEKGKIADSTYLAAKETGELDIIATVKFSSKETFAADQDNKLKTNVYCLITSPPLLAEFMKNTQ